LGDNADHQFVGRGDLGYIVTDDFDGVPYNLRYFAGGDQSVRGYDYESLSPEEDGLLLGGQVLAVGSLEYNYQFRDGWRAAVFADAGNAYDENFSNETKYGVGVGVRWASPVGPIRVDVAAGVSEDSVPIRLHFFIGPPL
jgi:translocation and assembly module TamA